MARFADKVKKKIKDAKNSVRERAKSVGDLWKKGKVIGDSSKKVKFIADSWKGCLTVKKIVG
ncbi:hypothetical protein FH972_014597 [Carpinus fangiana]|uniref:Uncharacterized protein n=1 Tax=Carpinus fangiana TaxID=176857 RepID=A0A5N6RC31_9ROSI|nr:hypothetical protein FH972_014597 [Carpinus fangiana]